MKRISVLFKRQTPLSILCFLALASTVSMPAISATEDEGSLNEMWKDKSILEKSDKSKDSSSDLKSKPLDTDTNFKIVTPAQSAEDALEDDKQSEDKVKTDSTSAIDSANKEQVIKHLCTLEEIKESVLIKEGGWPGVGPFKTSDSQSNVFVDDNNNKIELKASGNKISKAELVLANISGNTNDLLTLQMTTDFLLEAVGAKGGKIANFNSTFEEKQNDLANGSSTQLTLNAGPLEVSIAKQNSGSEMLISVVNTELVDKEAEVKPDKAAKTESETKPKKTDEEPQKVASADTESNTSIPPKTEPKESILDKPVSYHLNKTETLVASKPTGLPTGAPKTDPLKERFAKLIENWQSVKRRAVKNRQKQNLFKILGGKALTRQSQAIKWLLDNHRYYEMTPKSMKLERYKELTPKKKYEVVAKISERRKFIDANKMRILKDTTTTYTVSYIVENIRGQWLITDSKVLK